MKELKHVKTFEQFSSVETDKIDEGIVDFFAGARTLIDKALKNPEDVEKVDKAISTAFAKQFGKNPKFKETVVGLPVEEKQKILQQAADKLKDKTIGILSLKKVGEEWKVLGSKVSGGASSVVAG